MLSMQINAKASKIAHISSGGVEGTAKMLYFPDKALSPEVQWSYAQI
jgi:hypothetical protein